MTVDPPTGRIWLGDVGEVSRGDRPGRARRELSVAITARGRSRTGRRPSKPLGREKPPLHEYAHATGTAVIGGYVYRGGEHAGTLGGKYVFGDNGGRIWALTYDGKAPAARRAALRPPRRPEPVVWRRPLLVRGRGATGSFTSARWATRGRIYRLARTGLPVGAVPRTLSKTGAFRDLKSLEPAPGPGRVRRQFAALVRRRREVAMGRRPRRTGDRLRGRRAPWTFPDGTVFVKHFEVVDERAELVGGWRRGSSSATPAAGRSAVTYRWRPDGSDADLLDDGRPTSRSAVQTRRRAAADVALSGAPRVHDVPHAGGGLCARA